MGDAKGEAGTKSKKQKVKSKKQKAKIKKHKAKKQKAKSKKQKAKSKKAKSKKHRGGGAGAAPGKPGTTKGAHAEPTSISRLGSESADPPTSDSYTYVLRPRVCRTSGQAKVPTSGQAKI